MKQKAKSKHELTIDWVVPFPIDVCADKIQNIGANITYFHSNVHKLAPDSYTFEVNAIPFSGNTFRQTAYFSTSIKIQGHLHSIDETSTHMEGFTLIRRRLEVLLLLGFVILVAGLAWNSAAGFCFITLFAVANLLWLVWGWLYFADYYRVEMMSLIREKFLPLSSEDEY